MNNEHYPALFRYADSASLKGQQAYLGLQWVYLASLVAGSILGLAATYLATARIFTTIVLAAGILILWMMRAKQDEKVWFDGRAVAESVKTVTWRFMMKVPPFSEDNADTKFIAQLKEIREARPQLAKHIAATQTDAGQPITEFMREHRAASLEDRKAFYLASRLGDQRKWYSRKAQENARTGSSWFWLVAALQITAVTFSVLYASGTLQFNVVSTITTIAAAFAAWGQMKRYDDLAQSYALAAQELEDLASLAGSQARDDDFAQLIEQAENSISREHTMWCARRDVRLAAR